MVEKKNGLIASIFFLLYVIVLIVDKENVFHFNLSPDRAGTSLMRVMSVVNIAGTEANYFN